MTSASSAPATGKTLGFIAKSTMSAPFTHSLLSSVVRIPKASEAFFLAAAYLSEAVISSAFTDPSAIIPPIIALAMLPHPITANFIIRPLSS